jgi:hypothetical protein
MDIIEVTSPALPASRHVEVPPFDRVIYVDAATVEDSVAQVKLGLTTAAQELAWQLESQVWRVMDYPDWPSFQEAMYGEDLVALVTREERPWFVSKMLLSGATQTEAAKALGVSQTTVNRDCSIMQTNNSPVAAAIEATPHARSGRPRRHAKKPRPKPTQVPAVELSRAQPKAKVPGELPPTAELAEEPQGTNKLTGEKGDSSVITVLESFDVLAADLQRIRRGLVHLRRLSDVQREVLLDSVEPLEESLQEIRTRVAGG